MKKANLFMSNMILVSLLLVGVYFIGTSSTEYVKYKLNEREPSTKIEQLYNLPDIDIMITDYTLNLNSVDYLNQLKRSHKINPAYLQKSLSKGKKPIVNFFIDTNGGSYDTMLNIIGDMITIRSLGFTINCYVVRAYSAGFTILQSCSKRIMLKGGLLGIHNTIGGSKHTNVIYDINRARFEERSIGKNKRDIVRMRRKELRYFTPKQALKNNFIDEVK